MTISRRKEGENMITMTDALRIASRSVSIYRTGRTSWTVYRPFLMGAALPILAVCQHAGLAG